MRVYYYYYRLYYQSVWRIIVDNILSKDYNILIKICNRNNIFNDKITKLKKYFSVKNIPMDEIKEIKNAVEEVMV